MGLNSHQGSTKANAIQKRRYKGKKLPSAAKSGDMVGPSVERYKSTDTR